MSDRFKTENGLIHFTFANEDRYFKDSLVCLNLPQNLYYELKEKGYTTVCFISASGERMRITFGDTQSMEAYEACSEKNLLSFFKKSGSSGEKEDAMYREIDSAQRKAFVHRLLKMMQKKESKSAYVFTIDAFDLLREYAGEFKELEEENYKYKNLILIKAPVEIEGSLKIISNAESIYRTSLFSEIQYIFDNYQNAHLYEKMQELMPYRISFMNKLEMNGLKNLVRYVIFDADTNVDERLAHVDEYAACIWYLYHSRKFRSWVKKEYAYLEQQFPVNPKRLFSEIENSMRKDASYRLLDGVIDKIRQLSQNTTDNLQYSIADVLQLDDYSEEKQEYLYIKNKTWDQIANLSYEFIDDRELKGKIENRMQDIRKRLLTACVNQDEKTCEQRVKYIHYYLDDAGNAQAHRDTQTFRYAVDGLHYAICKCGEQILLQKIDEDKTNERLEIEKSCLDCYRYILTYQGHILEYKEKILEKKKEESELVKKWQLFLKSIEDMENKVPDLSKKAVEYMKLGEKKSGIPTQWSNFYEDYLKKKKRAKELGETLALRKNLTDVLEEKLRHAQQMVNELDISLSGMDLSQGNSLRRKMEIAIDNISIALEKVGDEFMKSSSIKKINFEGISKSFAESAKHIDEEYLFDVPEKFEVDEELLEAMNILNEFD